ncbi:MULTISPECIES: hypothetical protein [Oceanospirillaceae]|uniref:ABC transporter substrate-binding protein n=1 Tax=Oceanobacter antarcticus TaxID=3133425 RepID=A0ABW8ND24_9GAMM|tara:strand:+ start:5575 stop:6477 length:903 start_codon:yes stop_codon:yes gene_type:complete
MDAWLFKQWFKLLVFPLLVGLSGTASALELLFITHKTMDSVNELAAQTAAGSGASSTVRVLSDGHLDSAIASADVVVLVGPVAVREAASLALPIALPVLATLVTREDIFRADHLSSAVYLEPPLMRQVSLAHEILGRQTPLGLLASSPERLLTLCCNESALRKMGVTPYFISDYPGMNRALVDLLQDNQALVGIYDPELFSAANIKNILITAYRQNRPLIGPSSAYIRAGALATTYSDLDDVASRLVDIIRQGSKSGSWPEPDYNPYFKVRYNEQVARSLNLVLPDENDMVTRLKDRERR